MSIKEILNKVHIEYSSAKMLPFGDHPMLDFFHNEIPALLYQSGLINQDKYLISASAGQGNWAQVPWIGIFDRSITTSAMRGIYIVYLFSADYQKVYLTLDQGTTDLKVSQGRKSTIEALHNRADTIFNALRPRGFTNARNMSLGNKLTERAKLYQEGAIFCKEYFLNDLPAESTLQNDLEKMLMLYQDYVSQFVLQNEWWPSEKEYTPGMEKQDWLKLLSIPGLFTLNSLRSLAAFYDFGGEATCTQISTQYGKEAGFYRSACMQQADKIISGGYCPSPPDSADSKKWPVLFVGRNARPDEAGSYVWKIRPELFAALTEYNILRFLNSEEHPIGSFDSWEILDESTAIKNCDKSFFEHNGSGVPKGISWFFDADNLKLGETKHITLIFAGIEYTGRISNESSDRRRVRIFWNSELGRAFNALRTSNPQQLQFKKDGDQYTVQFIGGEEEVPVLAKEYMKPIKDYITAKGFSYNGRLIENFYLSLKTKPFVILAGTSGTGKTRLVKLFAEAIGAEYKLVPVRPDWSDSSDLFGHVDLNGKYVPGAVIDFIKSAQDHPGKPYFLCLDEMNLARVEYYLSDILSVIETRDLNGTMITSDPLIDLDKYGSDENAKVKYGTIRFPQNLYLVGTVNMDETTFPFSKKVLDRANTIEFNFVDLRPSFDTIADAPNKLQLPNSFLQNEYLLLAQCNKDIEFVSGICNDLQQINEILQKANAHIGYRVRDEIVFYLLNNKNEGELLSRNEAMDNAIMQKILPRIQGSSASIHDMLCELFKHCGGDHNQRSGDSDADKMWKVISDNSANCKYLNSAKKLQMMVRRFEEDGFTSFWL